MKHLHSLEPAEVSLVPKGANKRKFLVLKSMGAKMTREELLKAISCEPSSMAKVEKVLQSYGAKSKADEMPKVEKDTNEAGPLDERAQAALKAVVRILTPFKDSLSPLLLHEVLDAAGIQMQSAAEAQGDGMASTEKSSRQSPEPIKEEHKIEAMKVGKAAEEAHLEKLGYRKYPDAEMAQKTSEEKVQEEEQKGTMKNPDVEKSAVAKSSFAGLPEETRRELEAVFKSNADLRAELDAVKRVGRRKEMVQKAESLSVGLPTEEVAETLLELEASNPKLFEKVEKMLSAASEQVKKGALFSEMGSSSGMGHIGSTWEAIEKAAEGFVAKSGLTVSKEMAVDKFLATPEGKRMYGEYMKTHASSR